MKKITLLLICCFFIQTGFSQGSSVSGADPFCSGGAELVFDNFYNSTGTTNAVGCLGSTPNAAYYYLTIDRPGNLVFTIAQVDLLGNPIDVDFIAWGPFASIAAANTAINLNGCLCPNNTDDPTFYPYNTENITDCSYDIAPVENLTITGANTGDIYIVLITNYDNNEGTISFQQTDGNGSTSCNGIPVCGSGFYDSGGDSGNYSNNDNTTTTIYPDVAGGIVTVDFTAFNLGSGDSLIIYDGPNTGSPSLGTYTGTTLPGSFTSTDPTGTLTFVFTSDTSVVSTGWVADVTCTEPVTTPICGSTFNDSGGRSGDYSSNEYEITTFYPDTAGEAVTVTFNSFNIEAFWDYLYVYDGPNTVASSLIDVYTGTTIAPSFTSTHPSGALTFLFISDGVENYPGWDADITCAVYTPPVVCGTTVYDSGGVGSNYSNYDNITTTYYPNDPNDPITITFTSFYTEEDYDFLYVYDGPDTSSPLLDTLDGNLNTALPGPYTSTHPTGTITFLFISDYSYTEAGWVADITCTPNTPTVNCGDTFYDSGGAAGNYSNNENITTTIYPDNPGEVVTATFTSFNTRAGDILNIYDGEDTTTLIGGPYVGNLNTNLPGPFTSSDPSGALTFVFISNGNNVRPGWAADITCDIPCDLTISETLNPIGTDECSLIYNELTATSSGSSGTTETVFSESFDAGAPTGWTVNNANGRTQWYIDNTSYAGGNPEELILAWLRGNANSNGTWSLATPTIPITGYTNLQFSFKQFLSHYDSTNYPFTLYIETSVDGSPWVIQNTIAPNTDIGPNSPNIDLSSLSGNTLQIRFRMTGYPFGFNYWAIDDILLTADGSPAAPQITWSPTNGLYTDPGLTTAYAGGFTDTVYAAPNGTETYTAEDQNGCTDTVTVIHNRKVWNGSQSSNWYDEDNWTPTGVPTALNCVVIPDGATTNNPPIADYISILAPIPPATPALGKNLTIEANGRLEIESNSFIEVTEWVDVDAAGLFILRDSASLIQDPTGTINNNSGNIIVQRSVTSLDDPYDYIYWSSPVENFDVEAISPSTSPNLIWKWLPTQPVGGGTGHHGDWRHPMANEPMSLGTGYIVRNLIGTTPYADTPAVPAATAEFTGRPNNGNINVTITRGTHTSGNYQGDNGVANGTTPQDDNWNLIGNPYPSGISYADFIADNPFIDGTIYLWTHQNTPSAISSPFYESFVYNYSDDYIDYNGTGPNPSGFNGYIAAGQAFFVLMLDNANPNIGTSEQVVFNNGMRNRTIDNNQFYRTNQNQHRDDTIERHRIWLDLITPNQVATSILVGYVEGATNENDRLYDGYEFEGSPISFYSLIDEKKMSIQGRALPFNDSDRVPLGFVAPETGNYSIAINTLDGLFETTDQTIFLEDTYTNIIHDLRVSPYSFNIDAGTFDDRFILRYTNNALSIDEFSSPSSLVIMAPNSTYIKVTSGNDAIDTVTVYDLLGRVLIDKKDINAREFSIDNVTQSDGAYIVKATLYNGKQKIQKVVIRR